MEVFMRSFKHCNYNRLINISRLVRFFSSQTPLANVSVNEKDLLRSFNEDIEKGGAVPVFRRALLWSSQTALQDDLGQYTYGGLHRAARHLARDISKQLGGETKTTVAYLCGNDASHVIVQWAIWISGNIAVPLSSLHPPQLLKYFVEDSGARLLVCGEQFRPTLSPLAEESKRALLVVTRGSQMDAQVNQPNPVEANDDTADEGMSNRWYGAADAMLIYTSGTTNKPKGVVWTHSAWASQISSLVSAWRYSPSDVVLCALPLHHVHGQLNAVSATIASGARLVMLPSFSAHAVWSRLLGINEREDARVTVFHGVPAMYSKLIAEYAGLFRAGGAREYVRGALRARVRLMCCGSAPLPVTVLQEWEKISGHRLLERYGMTEAGMALSNPYRPTSDRFPGCVGLPLPAVSARIAGGDPLTPEVTLLAQEHLPVIPSRLLDKSAVKDLFSESSVTDDEWKPAKIEAHRESSNGIYQGELLLKGPGVFKRYWNRAPGTSSKDFTEDGWFRTGDTASFSNGRFKILGRTSVDIIKTGGYKVSAIEVESALLEHPRVADAGVVGVPDETWGERVCAAIVLREGAGEVTSGDIREWCRDKMAAYQLPAAILFVDAMPRNVMGKLDKKTIAGLFAKKNA